ncbi:MAG: ABC transporter substrate-binding protein [Rubrobacter sp.]
MRRAVRIIAVVVLVAALALAGCGPQPGGSEEDGTDTVRLAFSNPTIFTTGFPFYVARDQGFYEDAGLQVEATFTGGGSETVQAVVSGSADIGTETSGPAAIGAFSQDAPIKIISASTTGLDLFWFAGADGPGSREDLAGQRVGYSSTGSSSHVGVLALSEDLENEGLEPIQAEAVGGPPDNYTAVTTGQISAGWSQPPFFLQEVDNGELAIVARGSEIGEYEDVAVRVNIANAQWAEQNPETVRRFLEVQQRSWDWIFENREEAVRIWNEAADLQLSEEVLLSSFDYYERDDMRIAPLDGRDILIQDARRFEFLEGNLSEEQINELFDLSYLPEGQQ